jgi:hypothetical protein
MERGREGEGVRGVCSLCIECVCYLSILKLCYEGKVEMPHFFGQ